MRLQKALSQAGITSRRKAEELIEQGRVTVNGERATIGQNADPSKDDIRLDGDKVESEKKIYLMLNKPEGYITTSHDPYGRLHVLHLLHIPQRVFPVGRLDKDTTGLLILTNDGAFANRITHPRYEIPKVYIAKLDRKISERDIKSINEGVVLDGKNVVVRARRISGKSVEIRIHTGLNKEVKRIFKKYGYWVRGLTRTRIGPLKLDVKVGKYRHLVQSEVEKFRD